MSRHSAGVTAHQETRGISISARTHRQAPRHTHTGTRLPRASRHNLFTVARHPDRARSDHACCCSSALKTTQCQKRTKPKKKVEMYPSQGGTLVGKEPLGLRPRSRLTRYITLTPPCAQGVYCKGRRPPTACYRPESRGGGQTLTRPSI